MSQNVMVIGFIGVILLENLLFFVLLRKKIEKSSVNEKLEESVGYLKDGIKDCVKQSNDDLTSKLRVVDESVKEGNTLSKEHFSVIESSMQTIQKDNADSREKTINTISEGLEKVNSATNEGLSQIKDTLNENEKTINVGLGKVNDTLFSSVRDLQNLTEEKLLTIGKKINDKLDTSLNKRLDDSFGAVAEQLGGLQQKMGELRELSNGVANINRTFSNVKTRGVWGEIQLGYLLEDMLNPSQYDKNVKIVSSSEDFVEYAIKLPSRDSEDSFVYLPIDSKFPLDVYNKILEVNDSSGVDARFKAKKDLERRVKEEAKKIKDKYIIPPITTDFAIMFLPTESLYAEVIKIEGLLEFCQNNSRVVITGPSTLGALLNSIRIGYANVVINKKAGEVQKMLSAIKMQYGKLDELINKTKRQLDLASKNADELKRRANIIRKRMGNVEMIDQLEADNLLGIESSYQEDDSLEELAEVYSDSVSEV